MFEIVKYCDLKKRAKERRKKNKVKLEKCLLQILIVYRKNSDRAQSYTVFSSNGNQETSLIKPILKL